MIRRLTLLIATALLLGAQSAYGLGLGSLELNSALNQRFSAEIELTNVRGLEIEEILPNLASQQDFDRVGVERNYLLTDLRFKVVRKDDNRLVVQVTSSKPVIEPFLNFIVEVLWPTGRILREYTVLLDPPVFGEGGVEPVQPSRTSPTTQAPAPRTSKPAAASAPVRPSASAPRQAPPTSAAAKPVEKQAEPARSVAPGRAKQEGDVAGGEYGVTGPGDTLWKIALRVRPSESVTVQQTMLALQRANPEAFINNNINLLKAGHVLRIPDAREIREESATAAIAQVRSQNQQFSAYKSGSVAQLDASRRQTSRPAAAAASDDGELKLLASDQSTGTRAGSGGAAKVQQLENELAVAEEDLDRARRANTEMNVRLDDLQGQLETLNELLKLKDDQLAALRAEVQKMQASSEAQPAQTQPATPPSDSLLSNPIVLGVLGLIVVGGVAGGLFFMRRRQQAATGEDDFVEDIVPSAEPQQEDLAEDILPEEDLLDEEEVAPETNDVIGEVEIYIAYGRFPQAITFLQNAIEAEPDRADIQLKLLEVYVQTEDSTAFNLQLEQLRMLGDEDAVSQALQLQQKIPGAAEDAAASMDATVISSSPIEAIGDPDDDMSFDLDDLDSETEEDDLSLSSDLDLDDSDELDLDLGLDDETGDTDATVVLGGGDTQELDLDLTDDGLELDLDLEDDAEDGLELDLDDLDDGLSDDSEKNNAAATIEIEETDLELDLDLTEDSANNTALDLEDEISLDLEDDDILDLSDADLGGDDLEADLENAAAALAEKDDEPISALDADDGLTLDLDDDEEISLDFDDDDTISLELDEDGAISLDLDDDEFSLDLDGDDDLNLDDDAGNKLDLARAYIDMGDSDGARSVLKEVMKDGTESEKAEANDLLERID